MTYLYWLALVPHIVWSYALYPRGERSLWYRISNFALFSTMLFTGWMFAYGLTNLLSR